MLFDYRAKQNKDNELVDGIVEAETETIAERILEEKDLTVLFLQKKKRTLEDFNLFLNRVKIKDLVIFSRQLSILISAGVRLVSALEDIAKQTSNPKLKKIILDISAEVEGGIRFSEALAKHPKVFNNYFINLVRSGEVSGRLQEVLNYLAEQLEKDYDLKSKIKGAMIYPAFVISGLIIIGVLMIIFVVPQLTDMLEGTGAELPFATRLLIGLSDFMISYWWLLLLVVVGLVVLARAYYKSKSGHKLIDSIFLKLPIFGGLFQYIYVVRFCNGFRTLLSGGVDIVDSLEISASMMDNVVYKNVIMEASQIVQEGGEFSDSFEKSKYVPKMVSQMLDTGESSGRLDDVLDKISKFYSREIDNLLKNLMSLLEPFVMIVLGIAVAIMVAAIILPMYQVSTNL